MKTLQGSTARIVVFLMALLCAADLLAEPEMFASGRIGKPYWYAGAGKYSPDGNAQLGDQEGKFDLLAGGGYRASANFAWELDLLSGHQNVNTPASIVPSFFGTVDPRSSLDTTGFAGTAKYIYPLGRLEPYAGGGIGLYTVRFRATGQQLGFPGELTRDTTTFGMHLVAGADFYVTNSTALGIEWRKIAVKANLGDIIPGEIDAGGNCLSLILRSAI